MALANHLGWRLLSHMVSASHLDWCKLTFLDGTIFPLHLLLSYWSSPVIELSECWEGSTPQFIFQLNPPEQRSIAQYILLSACIKKFPIRVSLRSDNTKKRYVFSFLWIIYLFTSIDVTHAECWCSIFYIYAIYTAMYICVCTVDHLAVDHTRSKDQRRRNAIQGGTE